MRTSRISLLDDDSRLTEQPMSKEAMTKDELLARLQSIEWSDIEFKEAA